MSGKVVICGAGFLGSHIARSLVTNPAAPRHVQLSSRNPRRVYEHLKFRFTPSRLELLSAVPADIEKTATLRDAFQDASVVVSLVGTLYGTTEDFERIQWKGAENVAKAAKEVGAKLIHISAIGADKTSPIAYSRTKALGEEAAFNACPDATVIRPSLIFGPEDSFFNRFSQLSQYLPFLPVFGDGSTLFQPVYVVDVATAVEIIARDDPAIREEVDGKIIEAGGPQQFTFRQIMELVLKYNGRRRPILPVPFAVGKMQGLVLEHLPPNVFTMTRDQVEQLKFDNIVTSPLPTGHANFAELLKTHGSAGPTSVHDILPTYL